MCGIAGYLTKQKRSCDQIKNMLDAIKHRGPDGISMYNFGDYTAGMCRLAINDLTTGAQPLYNTKRNVVVIYNGEIYNYPKLRKMLESRGYVFRTNSDGEVICHLYDEYGQDCFSFLDGMFAIALWDETKAELLLARDSIGEKPLYYSEIDSGAGVVFASELGALKRFAGLDLSLNRQALWDFPTFLWIPEPDTVYQNINALPRGNILRIFNNVKSLIPFQCAAEIYENDIIDDKTAVNETRRIIDEAVCSRLLSDVKIGSFLSGGLDSSIIATIASRELGPIDTFSIGFEALSDPYHGISDESAEAAHYAKQLKSRHHLIRANANNFRSLLDTLCRHGGQPFAVSSGLGILAISKAARDSGIKVLLSGDCADECFGGYSWYAYQRQMNTRLQEGYSQDLISWQNIGLSEENRALKIANYHSHQQAWAWHYYAHESEKSKLFSTEMQIDVKSSLRHFESYNAEKIWSPIEYIKNDRVMYMTNEMLRKLDFMTMAYSVEGRVPFAAPSVINHANRLQYSQLIRGKSLKWVLREAYSDILPKSILSRAKHGFNVPIDHWLRGEWSDLVSETFSRESALFKSGLISATSYDEAKKMLSDNGRLSGHTIFCFVVLNRWLENEYAC